MGCVHRQRASTEISKPYVRVVKHSCLAGEENNEKRLERDWGWAERADEKFQRPVQGIEIQCVRILGIHCRPLKRGMTSQKLTGTSVPDRRLQG